MSRRGTCNRRAAWQKTLYHIPIFTLNPEPPHVPVPVVEEVPEIGSEVAVSLEAIPEDLVFESGEAFSMEKVDDIPMEELFSGSHGDGSVTSSSDITSISLDTVLDLKLAS